MSADESRPLSDYADQVEVRDAARDGSVAGEEAAILYANGNVAAAESVLVGRVDADPGAPHALWMMLLDLYRLDGRRDRFEARVIDYARRFECSPPAWRDFPGGSGATRRDPASVVNLSGRLGGDSVAQLAQLEVVARARGAIRIDLGRVRGIDDQGCRVLLDSLARLRRARVKVALVRGETLIGRLGERVGEADAPREAWLLLLELLQHAEEPARFETLAIDYAVRFEESPPSWENPAQSAPRPLAAVDGLREPEAEGAGESDVFRLEGELTGASQETLRAFAAFADGRRTVSIDCSRLRRLDFVTAGMLFNLLSSLRSQGCVVELLHVNALVDALLKVMGVDQLARLAPLR